MDITVALTKMQVKPERISLFLPFLQSTLLRFNITTDYQQAAFLSQATYESRFFTAMEESLYYTDPKRIAEIFKAASDLLVAQRLARNPEALANTVYANRGGNGNFASGDGWKYRGRGIFQLTLKENYLAAMMDLDKPYLDSPDLVAQPEDAVLTAGWFWSKHGLNALADKQDILAITKAINGSKAEGYASRNSLYQRAFH